MLVRMTNQQKLTDVYKERVYDKRLYTIYYVEGSQSKENIILKKMCLWIVRNDL